MTLRTNRKPARTAARTRSVVGDVDIESDDDETGEPNHSLSDGHRNGPALSFEDGPVDSEDPNYSAWCAEAGAEDRLEELGF